MEYSENEPMQIQIKNQEDREEVAKILVRNGYTVRLRRLRQEGKNAAISVVEFWNQK